MEKYYKSASSDSKVDFSIINNFDPNNLKKQKAHGMLFSLKFFPDN